MDQRTRIKTCRRCGEPKSLESFARNSSASDGRRGTCKVCAKVPRVRIRVSAKACAKCRAVKPAADFGNRSSTRDGLNSHCKPCIKAAKAEEYRRDKAKINERSRANYAANREARIALQMEWKRANPDKVREYARTYNERYPERGLEQRRRWMAANPEREATNARNLNSVRRARKRNASVGPVDLDALWLTQGGDCTLCAAPIDHELKYPDPLSKSVDHIVPLSRGGTHEQSNLAWAHLVCNMRKGAKAP